MKVIEYPEREQMMVALADLLASELRAALRSPDRVGFAVPGGTTPGPIFDNLSMAPLDWSRVTVMLTDERWVPEESERSNTGLLRRRLFQNEAASARFFGVYSATPEPEDALDDLILSIRDLLPLSLVVLGMGADMHTASLFPGADGLAAALSPDAPPLLPIRGGGASEPRVTLTAPVLQSARDIHVVITGDEKKAALETARGLSPELAPISVVLPRATVHWAP